MIRMMTAFALIAATTLAGPALAANRDVTVTNNSSTPMVHFFASNVGTKDWEEDILGVDALDVGESVDVTVDDGSGYCKYDFKATFSDGASAVKGGVNVCEISSFDFTD